jgi:hypothetical protein
MPWLADRPTGEEAFPPTRIDRPSEAPRRRVEEAFDLHSSALPLPGTTTAPSTRRDPANWPLVERSIGWPAAQANRRRRPTNPTRSRLTSVDVARRLCELCATAAHRGASQASDSRTNKRPSHAERPFDDPTEVLELRGSAAAGTEARANETESHQRQRRRLGHRSDDVVAQQLEAGVDHRAPGQAVGCV